MTTRLCVWLGILVVWVIATDTVAEMKSAEPEREIQMLVEPAQLQKKLNDPTLRILDVRSMEEYAKGRIPGAVRVEWKELVAKDGRFKTKTQLQQLFRSRGIMPDETAVCY